MTLKQLSRSPPKTARKGKNYGGIVGGSAAECTAVACCVPLTMTEMLFLGLYKVPTGLCKKAYARKRRNHRNQISHPTPPMEDPELDRMVNGKQIGDNEDNGSMGTDESDTEEKLAARFPGTGFWREHSDIWSYTYDLTLARN
ncbi:uncharacterized protein LOC120124438 [Hibiscus syriacus]|uniref:uncharacterized protein LOC120124438 n=1 Tax=Hibiscus syriacus TaxID=106335 RepID=UPI00192239FD|nr:uncharacterized protein LOC120124438 [Hibiscus syriacus]